VQPSAAEPEKPEPAPAGTVPPVDEEVAPLKQKRLKPLSIVLLFVALALLAFATVFLIRSLEAPEKQAPRSTIPSPQREQFAPEQFAPEPASPPSDTSRALPDTATAQ
jgi:hypothetical protein